MSWKLAKVILMVAVLVVLGIDWYNGTLIPAYIAFMWAFVAFLDDLVEWMDELLNKLES